MKNKIVTVTIYSKKRYEDWDVKTQKAFNKMIELASKINLGKIPK